MEKETSEFGKGFVYNLVLFAKHYEKFRKCMESNDLNAKERPDLWKKGHDDMWFNGAGDHFIELEVPEQFKGTEIGKLALELQDEAIERRLAATTKEEFLNFFKRLEHLCRLIDEALGIEPVEASWN